MESGGVTELTLPATPYAMLDALEKLLVEECPCIPLDFQKRTIGTPGKNSGIILRPFNGGAYGAAFDFRHAGKLD